MKAIWKKGLCLLLCCMIPASATACAKTSDAAQTLHTASDSYKVFSETFTQVYAKAQKGKKLQAWRDGFVTGNGENGSVNAGSPYNDTLIYQNNHFIMPRETIRQNPDISDKLDTVRQMIVNGESYQTFEPWYSVYSFHPAGQLRLTQAKHSYSDYIRWCDYESGEVGVQYTDKNGTWVRRTFTSRTDNVTITAVTQSTDGVPVDLTLSFDDISKMYNYGDNAETGLLYKKVVSDSADYIAEIAHYPAFEGSELANAGYATLTYIVNIGGSKQKVLQKSSDESINVGAEQNPTVEIRGAQAVYLITVSDRDLNMGAFSDFAAQESYLLLDTLYAHCKGVADAYGGAEFDYDKALAPSREEQSALFNRVKFDLDGDESTLLSNEDLLAMQRKSKTLLPAMVERVYNAGRYAMIACSGGSLIGRLYGMWTGEWGTRWNGAFTMDANVNLQCSGMNSANCISYGESYIRFVLNQVEDWKINALHNYGFTDAIQVPCNTDGDSAISVEYSTDYSFEYWNNGASWMLQPIYEFYQCYGNVTIETDAGEQRLLEDILLPLLQLQANFWAQMLTPEYYTDAAGNIHHQAGKTALASDEFYCIIPSYSPENTPANLSSARTANSAADISAARKGFEMLIAVQSALDADAYRTDIERWQALMEKLPPYLYDETGAVKEWAANSFEENNAHRHISHLYCAWPANETQDNPALTAACLQALENRNSAGKKSEETQTHGWLHKGLVGARLKSGEMVYESLERLLTTKVYYDSMMTDHNTNRGSDCYCTDTALGILGVLDEMLLYSDSGEIEVFPAMIADLPNGSISGLMAKTQAQVGVQWQNGTVEVQVTSLANQQLVISCAGSQAQTESFRAGETKTFTFQY